MGSNSGANSLAARMTRRSTVVTTEDDFDAVPGLLVCGNGVLDLTTAGNRMDPDLITLLPHDPIRRVSMMTPVDYNPDAKCPIFMRYWNSVLDDPEVRHYLWKGLGSTLLGRPSGKIILNLVGPPDTGKSVLLSVMSAALGQYGTSAMAKAFLADKRGSEERGRPVPGAAPAAQGADRHVIGALARGALYLGLLKQLTGKDPVVTRGVYGKDEAEWTPRFMVVLAANQFVKLDSVSDTGAG